MIKKESNHLVYFTFEKFSSFPSLVSCVFTRLGGKSQFPYGTLNLGIHVNDFPENVKENRAMVMNELEFPLDKLIAMEQVHSDNFAQVGLAQAGRGAYNWEEAISSTDALICGDRGVILMAVVADCSVAVFYSPRRKVIGIAHCGWRGTVKRLSVKVIENLEMRFRCDRSELLVGISPCIGVCCYEVGEEVFSVFHENFGQKADKFFENRQGKLYLDMKEAIKFQLLDSGITEENIEFSEICTSCRTDLFFSHRRERGKTGRNGVFIGMRSGGDSS